MITQAIRSQFIEIVGEEWYKDSTQERYCYSFDATPLFQAMPDAILIPGTVAEVAAILKVANHAKIPVITRGSGTNLAGGTVPIHGGIVLLMNRFNKMKEIDLQNLTVTVEPGVITADLHQEVEAKNLFYPPDPGSMRVSTIGGNLAQCAGGMRGVKYGVTKDYVLGLQYVLPSGDVLRCGGKNIKDVAGYDMTRLLVGSEGTLAVITEVILKLLPLPAYKQTLVAYYDQLIPAAQTVEQILANRIIPATMELLDQSTIKVVDQYAQLGLPQNMKAMLLIEQDGHKEQVKIDMHQIATLAKRVGAVQVKIAKTADESKKLMMARRVALSALSRIKPTTILEDATVPRSRIAEMLSAIEKISNTYQLTICTFGHAGDGNLHPTCLTDERNKDELKRVEAAFQEIFETAIRLGGTVTGEHGVGIAKQHVLKYQLGATSYELMKRIKRAFDPNQILNPGKIFTSEHRKRLVVRK
ncbi:glycolate oxidase [Seinonella peptonophila]|uniref:Glycolate oxidase n=1 Tax=Seinonella peptonophila TaxID=112248 RepID=A0A1M4SRP6_9BACL|nr:FAD-linked oxidase C-terminal domain-containing protein [Seinonella peptonophila]SHE34914.1 glycolate oxidase [Seinonella peptonophila]